MILRDAYERFAKKTPVSVMVRATLENVLCAERLDAVFDENAEQQYEGDLLFSTVAGIMGQVVCQIRPSVNAVYTEQKEEIGVTGAAQKKSATFGHLVAAVVWWRHLVEKRVHSGAPLGTAVFAEARWFALLPGVDRPRDDLETGSTLAADASVRRPRRRPPFRCSRDLLLPVGTEDRPATLP